MSLVTVLARLEALQTGRAQPLATVRHRHLAARPLVFVPLTAAGEAGAPLGALVGTEREEPRLLVVPQPRDRDLRFAFLADLAEIVLPYIDSYADEVEAAERTETDPESGKRVKVEVELCADAPQLIVPSNAGIDFIRLLGRSMRFRRTAEQDPGTPYPAPPRVPLLGRWFTHFAERARVPGSSLLLSMTGLLSRHWATGQSSLEDQHLGALLAWIDPSGDGFGAEAALRAELERDRAGQLVCPPAGPATDPAFDNKLLAPAMERYDRARRASEPKGLAFPDPQSKGRTRGGSEGCDRYAATTARTTAHVGLPQLPPPELLPRSFAREVPPGVPPFQGLQRPGGGTFHSPAVFGAGGGAPGGARGSAPTGSGGEPSLGPGALTGAEDGIAADARLRELTEAERAIRTLIAGVLRPTWEAVWHGLDLLGALPEGATVADRWTRDRWSFTGHRDRVRAGEPPQPRRDDAVTAANKLAARETAQAQLEALEALDDPLVMAGRRLAGEAFAGEVTEVVMAYSEGRRPSPRPLVTLRTEDRPPLTAGTKVYRSLDGKPQAAEFVGYDDRGALVLRVTDRMGRAKEPAEGSVPVKGDVLTWTLFEHAPRGGPSLPEPEKTPWTHGGPPDTDTETRETRPDPMTPEDIL
jgi:hypothetical protein